MEVNDIAPITEPGRTDVGSTLKGELVQNLPLISRNPFNFILNQPNITGRPNTEFGVPRRVNANGFNNRINFQIDGNNNVQSDRAGIRLIPISNTFVEEVQNVTNGMNAEFGNSVGTVFNTITRSGSNDLHGDVGFLFRRTGFSAAPALLRPGQAVPETNVNSFPVAVGGPIVKNKLFFFGAFERVKRDLPIPVTVPVATLQQLGLGSEFGETIPFRQGVQFFMAKTDWQLNSNHRLTFRFNGHRNDSPFNNGNAGGQVLLSRTYNFVDRSYVFATQWIGVLSPTVVNELRFQSPLRNQRNDRFEATGTGAAITIPGVASFGGPTAVGFQYRELAPELSNNLSWMSGNHTYKFGINWRAIRDTQVQQTSANYTFPTVQAYLDARNGVNPRSYTNFTQTVGEPSIKYNHNFVNLYAQDGWKIRPNITLNYGLRYDLFLLPNANTQSPLPISRSFRVDRNNISPRVGLAVGLGKKLVWRAGAGVFFDAPQTDMYRRAILNNGSPIFFNVSTGPTTTFAPAFPNVFSGVPTGFTVPTQDVTAISPDFRSLYSFNVNTSLTYQVANNTSLTATYLHTKGTGLPIYANTNLIASGNSLADGRPIFGTTRINPAFNNIVVAQSVGSSNYNGMTLTLNQRNVKGFEGFATYTWSHAIDDAPEQNNIDSAGGWLSDITNRRRDKATSLNDRRHAMNITGIWSPKYQLSSGVARYLVNNNRLSLSLIGMSGDIFNIGSNRVLNGDPTAVAAMQRPLFIGRNTLRGPRTVQLDARYARLFPIKEKQTIEFFAETTNLFNRTNVTNLVSNATVDVRGFITAQPTQQWTAALDQRLVQFGINFRF
jgi:hypothetical protein